MSLHIKINQKGLLVDNSYAFVAWTICYN